MSTKIGHFEILSELAKSSTSTVYKANDSESGQTVALKAIQLSAFGEHAARRQPGMAGADDHDGGAVDGVDSAARRRAPRRWSGS